MRGDQVTKRREPTLHTLLRQRNLQHLAGTNDLVNTTRLTREVVKIAGASYVGVAFMADIHLGDAGLAFESFWVDMTLICQTPNLYVVLGGDMIDNHIKHLPGIVAAGLRPADQWIILERLLTAMKPKILAIISGNHEAWTAALTGYDPLAKMARGLNLLYDPYEIQLDLSLRKVTYRIAVRHKYRYNSSFNPTNSVKKYYDFFEADPWDVGCVADKHEASVEPFYRHGKDRWAVRPGSYQTLSTYARSGGWPTAHPVTPCVIFDPTARRFHAFKDLDWGVATLKALNRGMK